MASGQKKNNLRMALILASVAAVFFVGIVLKMAWLAH
ncbi:MAG TPA: cytochrome oxidase small assembly protein [Ramlibacter sp.]|nr:cytochrome oxidase small assembly protein [Ramlibacter sp.]